MTYRESDLICLNLSNVTCFLEPLKSQGFSKIVLTSYDSFKWTCCSQIERHKRHVQTWHERQFIRWGGAVRSFRRAGRWRLRWPRIVAPPAIPIEFGSMSKIPNLRQDAGSTVWHKAWHIKNEVKISRLPVSSPFRAFDNSVASICTWKGLEKLDSCANSYLCRLEASHLSKLPFLGTKHFVSDFLPLLPFDLKTIPNLLIPTLPVGYQSLPHNHMEHFLRYLSRFIFLPSKSHVLRQSTWAVSRRIQCFVCSRPSRP